MDIAIEKHRLGRNWLGLGLILLIALNILMMVLASHVPEVPLTEWRKGPVMHARSLYGPIRAPRLFWAFTIVLLDSYVAFLLGFRFLLRKRGWVVSLLAMVLALVTTEVTLKIRISHMYLGRHFRPHPDIFYWNARNLTDSREVPDAPPESTNSRGFRGKDEVPMPKPSDEYRVFVVGDSSAFGHGVLDDETFSDRLETEMSLKLGKPVRVINAACPGHCTYEGLIVFKTMGIPLQPDLLIVSYNNDPAPEYSEEKLRAPRSEFARRIRRVLYHSDYYLMLQRTMQNRSLNTKYKGKDLQPALVPRVSLPDYRANLHAFVTEGKKHNCDVMFVRMPINYEVLNDLKARQKFYNPVYPAALSQLCRESGYRIVNVDRHVLSERRADVFLKGHQFHPGPEGHQLIAEVITDAFLAEAGKRPEPVAKGALVRIGYSTQTPLHCALGEILANTDILDRRGIEGVFLGFLRGRGQDRACREQMVDMTFSCEVPAMVHLEQHPDLTIAGSPGSLGDIALVVAQGSGIEMVLDLKGGTVLVDGGTSAELIAEEWVRAAGLEPGEDVRLNLMEGSRADALFSLSAGQIQGVILWDPWLTELSRTMNLQVIRKSPFWSVVFADERFRAASPEQARAVLGAIEMALQWASDNPEKTSAWVSQRSGISTDIVRAVLEKNRFFRGEEQPGLRLNDRIRDRLNACESFAKNRGMVGEQFELKERMESGDTL